MHKSGVEAMIPPPDDLRPVEDRLDGKNVDSVERYVSVGVGSALLISGLRRLSLARIAAGGFLIYRGATGICPVYRAVNITAAREGLQIEESITVNKSPDEVYSLWRRFENLPRFMSHLESVTALNEHQSHWVARIPPPFRLEWDAAILEDEKNKKISWRSLPNSSVDHAGSVLFHSVPARNFTELKIVLSYRPPLGSAGAAVAKLLSGLTEHQIREDLRAFKSVAEAGERPRIDGQPSGPPRGG